MKRAQKVPAAARRTTVTVGEFKLGDEDWYTPKALKLTPIQVTATTGKKGKGVRCQIGEGQFERRDVELRLTFEKMSDPLHSDVRDEFGSGVGGTFTRELLDQLIAVITAARDEAEKRGLFTPRPTPTSIEEVLAGTRSPAS